MLADCSAAYIVKTDPDNPSGKKTVNIAKIRNVKPYTTNPSHIRNKMKRSEMYAKFQAEKKRQKRERGLKREKEVEELGRENVIKEKPRTIENTREANDTWVEANDEEVVADEMDDEFALYFNGTVKPKVMITTRPSPSGKLFLFIQDLMQWIPNSFYYPRKTYSVKEICKFAGNKRFTHLLVLSEKNKKCNGMIISHLGAAIAATKEDEQDNNSSHAIKSGPTAFFKISNFFPSDSIRGHGRNTDHIPELNLNGFGTRLGHRVGRLLGSLFPHNAQFSGRQVVTFHNQRDYIFARYHRYIFEEGKEKVEKATSKKTIARLQELGPRFTMKMRWLQDGTFDSKFGEYEWYHKRKEMDVTRRKFHL